MKETSENKPVSSKKEIIGYIASIVVMLIAIITVWQVFLSGKDSAENRDTVVQVKTDTVRIKDSIENVNKTKTLSGENHTGSNTSGNTDGEIKSASEKDTTRTKKLNLSEDEKSVLKEELDKLPKKKQDRIKRKLKTGLNR